MTDQTTDRTIDVPLAPRRRPQGAASSLQAASRPHVTEPAVPAPETPKANKPKATRAPKKATPEPKLATRVQIAADVDPTLRGRARAAFRYAKFYENVDTFSEFVANALEAEIHRIEATHNDGEPFQPDTANLPAGRPTRL